MAAPRRQESYTVDPFLLKTGWDIVTEEHVVDGSVHRTAAGWASHDGRTVTLSQSGCASVSARIPLGYLDGSVSVQLGYNTSTSGTEAAEFYFMLVSGDSLLDYRRAAFPVKQVAWADLYSEGLNGSARVDLLLRFWPRNANTYGCPSMAPHLPMREPQPSEPCGVLATSFCATRSAGTSAIEVHLA